MKSFLEMAVNLQLFKQVWHEQRRDTPVILGLCHISGICFSAIGNLELQLILQWTSVTILARCWVTTSMLRKRVRLAAKKKQGKPVSHDLLSVYDLPHPSSKHSHTSLTFRCLLFTLPVKKCNALLHYTHSSCALVPSTDTVSYLFLPYVQY